MKANPVAVRQAKLLSKDEARVWGNAEPSARRPAALLVEPCPAFIRPSAVPRGITPAIADLSYGR